MSEKKMKLFVLDTNVILHDSACLYHFKEHDIVIPIQVLEELDKFKKGSDSCTSRVSLLVWWTGISGRYWRRAASAAQQKGNIIANKAE